MASPLSHPSHLRERIAMFGGSFDPVHHGHLLLAQDALETLHLDRLIFVPARINPHKQEAAPRASGADRLHMLHLATQEEPRFSVDPLELEREGPSYTVDTLATFRSRWPGAELFLLLGEDNLPQLHTWHQIDTLLSWVTLVTFGRNPPHPQPDSPPSPPAFIPLVRRVDVSSTEIRLRIARGLSIRYFLPEAVRLFLESHALYQSPLQRDARNPLRSSSS